MGPVIKHLRAGNAECMAQAMHLPHFLRFASDATLIAMLAGVLLALSGVAWWRDRQRMQRGDPDAVGLAPWRDIAAITSLAGLVLLAVAAMGWLKG
jgi:hypothetical protein